MGRDLAFHHRPHAFGEMVGQELAKQLLSQRVEEGAPPPAVMLQGPPGTGKTTTARILAAGLNCEEGPTASPCGQCPSCKAALGQRHEWILEVNAGANGGVDTLRELLEELRRPVPSSAWRVVILDECQAMTQAAQTALLKPLEEPPARTTICLATTHPQGIQAAIRSRCEPITFRSLPPSEISGLIERVAKEEKLKLKPETMTAVVERAGGSPRNALKLLSLAAEHEDSFELIGHKQVELLAAQVLRRLAEGDLAQAMKSGSLLTKACVSEFGDGGSALQALSEQLYNAISVQQLGLQADELSLGDEAWTNLRKATESVSTERLGGWIDLAWEAWGKAKGALLKPEALTTLTIVRMNSSTGVTAAPAAPAAPAAKPERKPAAVAPAPGEPMTIEALVDAVADANIKGILKKAQRVSLEGGLLTLSCGSTLGRSRLGKVADQLVDALAGIGVREVEVVKP